MTESIIANVKNYVEVSVVMPCLNEADTLAVCIDKAKQTFEEYSIVGEVIVADNGSTDGSLDIAARHGARIVYVERKGYGSALMGGIASARGKYVIMGDADDSYDFLELNKFIEKLREGYDLVQGCRLPSGGGKVIPGAMPFLHRWFGNPFFSSLVRRWFHAPIHDVYCGMRGFTREFYQGLNQRCTGMEFATEMIIKASMFSANIAEVPICLHPDGRRQHAPHLKTFRDGWRTLRYFLMCSPRWLFLLPGYLLMLLGLSGYALAFPEYTIFDAHTLLFASLSVICGYQALLFALFTKTYAINEGLLPPDERISKFFETVNLEKGIAISVLTLLLGFFLLAVSVNKWRIAGFGDLDYSSTMRFVIPGTMFVVIGFQTFLSSFFVSILGMKRM